jgi:hypothetical protein
VRGAEQEHVQDSTCGGAGPFFTVALLKKALSVYA